MRFFNKFKILKNKTSIKKEKVAVIGMGYVGFPLACAIAGNEKYEVYGLELDSAKVNKINNRIAPIDDKQAEKDIKNVKIHATSDASILKDMKYILICVPTPINKQKRPDLTPVKKTAESISKYLKKGQLIILESTVNPGVSEEEVLPILEMSGLIGGKDFELLHCPERINPGDPKWNVYNIPRNIGGLSKKGTKAGADFYRSFINSEINEVSSLKAAESTKIVENVFRDINLAYVNELAQSFDKLGIDVHEVINGAANKPFAFMAHYPGCGVGGHCIPVDPYYLIDYAKKNGFNHRLLKLARKINNGMPNYTVEKLFRNLRKVGLEVNGSNVGVLGLSYKANVGDMRESPSLEIIKELKKNGCNVFIYDPYFPEKSNSSLINILKNCDGVILAVNHDQFLKINSWGNIKTIIDGKNCLDGDKFSKKGILYSGIGREQKIEITKEKSENKFGVKLRVLQKISIPKRRAPAPPA